MDDTVTINGVESDSLATAAEKIAWELLSATGGYPKNLGLRIFVDDGQLCWDYDRSVDISLEKKQLLVDVVNLVCDSLKR